MDLIGEDIALDLDFLYRLRTTMPDTMADLWADFCESRGLDPEDSIGAL